MRRAVWFFGKFFYKMIVKPLVFRLQPDEAHKKTVSIFSRLGKSRLFMKLVAFIYKPQLDSRLTQRISGLEFNSPVGLSAGFDKNGEVVPVISNMGFGFGEVGSVTSKKCLGNKKPWFYRLPKTGSIVVNAGLANIGVERVLDNIERDSTRINDKYHVVMSVAKQNSKTSVSADDGVKDYITSIIAAEHSEAVKIIEINISCPNTYGGEPFTEPANLERLLAAIRDKKIKKPVYVKMPVDLDWNDFRKLLEVTVKYNVDGVTISNLIKNRENVILKDSLPSTVKGGLSGRPVLPASNNLIGKTYHEFGHKLIIIGVGGIFSAKDAYEKIRLGASLVEFITGLMYVGPQLASEINGGLLKLIKKDGFSSVSQVVGVDSK